MPRPIDPDFYQLAMPILGGTSPRFGVCAGNGGSICVDLRDPRTAYFPSSIAKLLV